MSTLRDEIFGRTALAAGREMMDVLAGTRVVLFGVGGVGAWCAESLVRTGVGSLMIVDSDAVAASNINRQLPATMATVGRPKVEVMRERLLAINPEAEITAMQSLYSVENASTFGIEHYDYAIDAIDSLACKADLILRCTDPDTAPRRAFYSSMGAALKLDCTRIAVDEFWKVQGCPLARALRTVFKRTGRMPRAKFKCVYSPERLANRITGMSGSDVNPAFGKVAVNGTFAHTTASFGFALAGLVVQDIYNATMPPQAVKNQ